MRRMQESGARGDSWERRAPQSERPVEGGLTVGGWRFGCTALGRRVAAAGHGRVEGGGGGVGMIGPVDVGVFVNGDVDCFREAGREALRPTACWLG